MLYLRAIRGNVFGEYTVGLVLCFDVVNFKVNSGTRDLMVVKSEVVKIYHFTPIFFQFIMENITMMKIS